MSSTLIFDNCIMAALWNLIVNAKKNIKVTNYKVELGNKTKHKKIELIISLLEQKVEQGVKVEMILNRDQPNRGVARYNVPAALRLKASGIDVRFLKNGRCSHSKIVLVDNEKFYIGSHNLSVNAFCRNFEAGLIVADSVQGSELGRFFDSQFATAEKF